MKKIFLMAIMIISTLVTIYSILFWQPSNKSITENKTNQQEGIVDNNKVNEVSKDQGNNKNTEQLDGSLKYKEDIPVDVAVQNSILKVSEDDILTNISNDDKEILERISRKLSSVDVMNIKVKFNDSNKEEGLKEGFDLIKTRVSYKDYEEIKGILSKYIDFSILENEV